MKRITVMITETWSHKHEIEIITDKDIDDIEELVEGLVNDRSIIDAEDVCNALDNRGYDVSFIEDDGDLYDLEFEDIWEE